MPELYEYNNWHLTDAGRSPLSTRASWYTRHYRRCTPVCRDSTAVLILPLYTLLWLQNARPRHTIRVNPHIRTPAGYSIRNTCNSCYKVQPVNVFLVKNAILCCTSTIQHFAYVVWIHTNICKQTKLTRYHYYKMKKTSVVRLMIFVEIHLCKLRATLRSRVLPSLLRSILPTFRLLFCRSKASRDVFWLLVEFKANRLRVLNTRTHPCRTYTIPAHSFGVRMNKPSVLFAADYCTTHPGQ